MKLLREFEMRFQMGTIEHLGLKLYASLSRVLSELVSNAWDADATVMTIALPDGSIDPAAEVVVADNGGGMTADELQEAYLIIGRNRRREANSSVTPLRGRHVHGRKGLGKLSAFGVADMLEIRTVKDGSAVCLQLNYPDMAACPENVPYRPVVVESRTGRTPDADGTEIRLKHLRRTYAINADGARKELARRFTAVGQGFDVKVNGTSIRPQDRRLKADCVQSWGVAELPGGALVDAANEWSVTGWVGLIDKASQTERGVDILAWDKVVELETMFGLKTTHIQYARAYVVGEVHANFLDDKDDNIATARSSILWDEPPGQALQKWGQDALRYVLGQWLDRQRKQKQNRVLKSADFSAWLGTRSKREQRIAMKLVDAIVDDEAIEADSAAPLLEVVKANIEYRAFQDLVEEIGETGLNVQTLLRLFDEWELVEARENLKLMQGRWKIIAQLDSYIQKGALEVQQMQPLFEKNGWLVDASWGDVTGQTTYSVALRKHFKEPKSTAEEERRIDILGYEVGGTLWVVELKRPQKTLNWNDLEQIERYVTWARTKLAGTGPDDPRYVTGLLLVGHLSVDATVRDKQTRLAGADIRVGTYSSLHRRAEKIWNQTQARHRSIAPEYAGDRGKATKG